MSEWDVAWTATATKSLRRLPENAGRAAIEFVYGPLAANPRRVGKELRFELEGLHVARRGDYRVIYEIDDDAGRVMISVFEHRSQVYRRR